MEINSEKQTEAVEQLESQVSEAPVERTPEEEERYLRIMAKAEMQNLLLQINNLTIGMVNHIASSNGVKQVDKALSSAALINAILFALDFGVQTSKVKLFDKGHKYYKENHTLAAMLVKAFETKTVMLAYQAKDEEMALKASADREALESLEKELEG